MIRKPKNRKSDCHPNKPYYSKGLCLSCYARKRYKKDPQKYVKRGVEWVRSHPEWQLAHSARSRAKKKGIEFDLNYKEIKIPDTCPVLGIPLIASIGRFDPNSPSLDRIDNSKGYTKENTIVVSFRANSLKRDATLDELRKIADFYSTLTVSSN